MGTHYLISHLPLGPGFFLFKVSMQESLCFFNKTLSAWRPTCAFIPLQIPFPGAPVPILNMFSSRLSMQPIIQPVQFLWCLFQPNAHERYSNDNPMRF